MELSIPINGTPAMVIESIQVLFRRKKHTLDQPFTKIADENRLHLRIGGLDASTHDDFVNIIAQRTPSGTMLFVTATDETWVSMKVIWDSVVIELRNQGFLLETNTRQTTKRTQVMTITPNGSFDTPYIARVANEFLDHYMREYDRRTGSNHLPGSPNGWGWGHFRAIPYDQNRIGVHGIPMRSERENDYTPVALIDNAIGVRVKIAPQNTDMVDKDEEVQKLIEDLGAYLQREIGTSDKTPQLRGPNTDTGQKRKLEGEWKLRTDVTSFQIELQNFTRKYREDGLELISINEWQAPGVSLTQSEMNQAVDALWGKIDPPRDLGSRPIDETGQSIDPAVGRSWSVVFKRQSKEKPWLTVSDMGALFTVSMIRSADYPMLLKVDSVMDTAQPFIAAFIERCKALWDAVLVVAQRPPESITGDKATNTQAGSILIVTATKIEAQAVLKVFSVEPRQSRQVIGNKTYYDLGIHGGAPIFMVQSEVGTATPGGALLTVSQAIQNLHPQAVIMCGIAYGLWPDKQRLGDILIAKQLECYEPQKVDIQHGQIPRGDRTTASDRLLDRFRSGDNEWTGASTHFGLVLSGEKLVNHPDFRAWLLDKEPEAIGGEMEGAGLYAAAHATGTEWILVKAVCDWADGQKNDEAQALAAHNAAQFVWHVLQLGGWGGVG